MERINEEVMKKIKSRLDEGAKKYGEEILIDDDREFVNEALEELLDACVYISCKIIQIENKLKWVNTVREKKGRKQDKAQEEVQKKVTNHIEDKEVAKDDKT